jgi:cytoskeletal protein CcmA (bactofilin family)
MFSSKSKDAAPTSSPMPSSAIPLQKRSGSRTAAPSIISADLVVNGTLTSSGDIQVDGRVEGDVHSAGLVIGDNAFIHGEVLAEEVTVRGRVQGSIRARKVLLASTCHVEGNILHEAFAVETGAFFEGNCRHSDNPLADDAGSSRSTDYANKPSPSHQPVMRNATPAPVQVEVPRAVAPTPAPTATFSPLKTDA